MTVLVAVLCAVLGLIIGSFLNVVIYRVPRGESIVRPRSHCPHCDAPVRPRDEVPVLSWLVLRGRCRDCGGPISARYPIVEFLTGLLFAATAVRFAGEWWRLPAFLFFAGVGITLALIDIDTHRLPNVIVRPSYGVAAVLLGLAAVGEHSVGAAVRAGLAGLAYVAVYWLLWFAVAGKGIGFGDVRLAGLLGMFLGYLGWGVFGVGAIAAPLTGGAVATLLLVTGKVTRKTKIAYGPALIAGALIAVFAGAPIARVWLRT
jgi:leader peptidase (prepilin peptidase)/N-methyltransferase